MTASAEKSRLRGLSEEQLSQELEARLEAVLQAENLRDCGYKELALVLCEQKRRLGENFHPYAGLESRRKAAVSNAMIVRPIAKEYLAGKLSEEDWLAVRFLDCVRWNRTGLGSDLLPAGLKILRENPEIEPHAVKAFLNGKHQNPGLRRDLETLPGREIVSRAVAPEIAERTFSTGSIPSPKNCAPRKVKGLGFAEEDQLVDELLTAFKKVRSRLENWSPARKAQISAKLEPVREFLDDLKK